MVTKFQSEFRRALNALVPLAPLEDAEAIKEIGRRPHLRHLPVEISAWLATTTHIRHNLTDYDALLDDGYGSDAARFFVLDEMNDILRGWQSTRLIDPDEDELKLIRESAKRTSTDLRDDEPD